MDESTALPEPFEIDVELLPEDLVAYYAYARSLEPRHARHYAGWTVIAFACGAAVLELLMTDVGASFLVRYGLVLAFPLWLSPISRARIRRHDRAMALSAEARPLLGPLHLSFRSEGVHADSLAGAVFLPWTTVQRVANTASHLLVEMADGSLVLPRRDFGSGDAFFEARESILRLKNSREGRDERGAERSAAR